MSLGACRIRLLSAALLVATGAAGCSRATEQSGDQEAVLRAEPTITVRIINHSQLDAVVFLVHDGTRARLGAVTAASTSSFNVRTRALGGAGEFVIRADHLGSRQATSTDVLHISQGTVFTWTLEAGFARGAVLVQD